MVEYNWLYYYVWVVPVLPLVSFIIILLLSNIKKVKPRYNGAYIAIGAMAISALYSFLLLLDVISRGDEFRTYNAYLKWLTLGTASIDIGIMVDQLTAAMLFMVTFVGLWIFVYSRGYMEHDPRFTRFFTYLSLFASSMLGLIIANNFLLLFICWELVGLCSYLLIGFWFEKTSAANAAKKAFITTKIGDLGILIALMLVLWATGTYGNGVTFNFYSHEGISGFFTLLSQIHTASPLVLTLIALFIFLGAMGKSAQFPLHVWLPDAMEGPTSVSALIHAATMVAAGVYLVGRAYPIFAAAVTPLLVVAFIGAFTAFFAATIAVTANDIKRVLAYSTLSQLGYMMLGLGVGGYTAGLFHLLTHAFFKALLFLGAGSVIHGMSGEQDIWKMGGLRKYMKWTCYTFLIGTLALVGFPLTSGFFSKDEILSSAYTFAFHSTSYIPFYLGFIPLLLGLGGVFLTAFYMTRCFTLTFLGDKVRSDVHPHESSTWMIAPLVVLAIFAALGGFFGLPVAQVNLFHHFVNFPGVEGIQNETLYRFGETEAFGLRQGALMLLSIILGFTGIGAGFLIYGQHRLQKYISPVMQNIGEFLPFKGLYILVKNKYFIDEIYRYCIVCVTLLIAKFCFIIDQFIVDKFVDFWAWFMVLISRGKRWADDTIVDGIAVNGWGYISVIVGQKLAYLQTGYIQNYIMAICIGIILLAIIGALKF